MIRFINAWLHEIYIYIGSTELPFKTRFAGHKSSFAHEHQATSTTLSKHVWNLKKSGKDYELRWEILKRCPPYHCGAKFCDLCLTEKLLILQADEERTINKHSEIMQKCRHRNKYKLKSVKWAGLWPHLFGFTFYFIPYVSFCGPFCLLVCFWYPYSHSPLPFFQLPCQYLSL